MQKTIVLAVFVLLAINSAPVHSEVGQKDNLFLNCSEMNNAGTVWIASEGTVRCMVENGATLYLLGNVALEKSVGSAFEESPTLKPKIVTAERDIAFTQKTSRFTLGLTYGNFIYKEPGLMELEGSMYGVMGSYIHQSEDTLTFTVSLEYVSGSDLHYTGETWEGTPLTAKADDYIVELRALLRVKPFFAGIGYRYWNDKIQTIGGYKREIVCWYVPLGIEMSGPLSQNWEWAIKAEYDFFLRGKVHSYLSQAVAGFNDPEANQDRGYGLRFSLEFKRELCNPSFFSIQPFFSYWHIDNSDRAVLTEYGAPIAYVYEPENKTTTYGIGLHFYF